MKKLSIIILIVLMCLVVPNLYAQTCNDSMYYTLKESTVSLLIIKKGGYYGCTGIIVKKDKNTVGILTAQHCTDEADKIIIDKQWPVSNIFESKTIDVSYITINNSIVHKNAVAISKIKAKMFSDIYTLGYVQDKEYFNCSKVLFRGLKNYYSDAVVIRGCSGSGVINSRGELVGILWGGYFREENEESFKSIITNIKAIREFLKEIGVYKNHVILIK